jgi:heme O synthase-like polyprenyltransferase
MTDDFVIARVKRNSVAAYVIFAVFTLIYSGFRGFLGLTCTAAVTMISFLWLEEVIGTLLQPSPHLKPWKVTVRSVARLTLLGVALLVSIFVARFNASSVLLGFSIVVVGIIAEAVYTIFRSFRRE